mgnify:CR=1 FL=1
MPITEMQNCLVPQLIGKTDMVPGRHNKLEAFIPNEIGEFYGQCAEFCGSAHAQMRFRVHVDSLANFDQWVDSMRSEPPEPTDGTVEAAGKGVFQLANLSTFTAASFSLMFINLFSLILYRGNTEYYQ